MFRKMSCVAISSLILCLAAAVSAQAGAPTDKIKETTDKILAIGFARPLMKGLIGKK